MLRVYLKVKTGRKVVGAPIEHSTIPLGCGHKKEYNTKSVLSFCSILPVRLDHSTRWVLWVRSYFLTQHCQAFCYLSFKLNYARHGHSVGNDWRESRITCWTKALSDAPLMIVAGRMISVSSGTTSLRKRMPKVQETNASFNLVNVKLQTSSQAKHVQARNFTDSMFGSVWLTWFGLNLAIRYKPHRYALKTLNFYSFFFIAEHTSNAILWHPLYFNAKFPSRSMMRLWVRLQIQERGKG